MHTILFVSHFKWSIDINKYDSGMLTNFLFNIHIIYTLKLFECWIIYGQTALILYNILYFME